jgi:thioesterase domain-containing protein
LAPELREQDWMINWKRATTLDVVDVPGNHLTMLEEHAGTTGAAAEKWLRAHHATPD